MTKHCSRWGGGRAAFGAVLASLGMGLAGCSSPSLPSAPSLSSMFGSSSTAADSQASATGAAAGLPTDFECPSVTVRQGAATLSSSVDSNESSAMNLRYQVSLGTTARECRVAGGMVSLKVGVQGRVVLGPQGAPGPVHVPVRFAVVEEGVDSKTIVTKLAQLDVSVDPGEGSKAFTHIEEGLDFPLPKGNAIDSYIVYVGFDPIGARQERRPPPRRARPR